jgi:hypothetical protein
MLTLTEPEVLPENAVIAKLTPGEFTYCYTTGPFSLTQNCGSLDWILLNDDSTVQKARVTVFKCPIGTIKTPAPPGPLLVTIKPGEATHNANQCTEGFVYEVQVECNSRHIMPYVSVWPGNFGVAIAGTAITAGAFVRMMPDGISRSATRASSSAKELAHSSR